MRERLRSIAACAARVFPAAGLLLLAPLWLPSAIASSPAGSLPPGTPPVARFVPDIDVYPQTFDITTGFHDEVLVGSYGGVLVFDGERWKELALPNNDIVRSLSPVVEHHGEKRIYVGGYNLFGYLRPSATGGHEFRELLTAFGEQIPPEGFADIWDVVVQGDTVYFRALNHVFAWNSSSGEARSWYHEGRFGALAEVDGDLVLQFRQEGLRKLVAGEWQPMPDTQSLSHLVSRWFPVGDDGLLSLQRDGGWHILRDGALVDVSMPENFPPSSYFSGGTRLPDGTLALVTPNGELFILDVATREWSRFVIDTGYLSGIVATDTGVLISGMDSIMHVPWPTHWMIVDESMGVASSMQGLRAWGDAYYVLTTAGVSRLDVAASHGEVELVALDWTDGHASWDLLPLDDQRALLANSYELLMIDDNGRRLSNLGEGTFYPRLLQASRFDPGLVYVGTELGLAAVRVDGTSITQLWRHELANSPGVFSLVELAPGKLLLGTTRGGVIRFDVAGQDAESPDILELGQAEGLAYGSPPSAWLFQDKERVLVSTSEGFFLYSDADRFERTDLEGLDSLRADNALLRLGRADDGEYWAIDHRNVYHRYPDEASWHEETVNVSTRSGLASIARTINGDVALVAGSKILFHAVSGLPARPRVDVRFTAIEQILPDDSRRPLPLDPEIVHQFESDSATIHFDYALPDIQSSEPVYYSARMIGLEGSFSNWTTSSTFTYYRMRPGEYSLVLRSRDSEGRISEAPPFRFVVLPSWYQTPFAIVIWVLLGVLSVAWMARVWTQQRLARLREETQRLEEQVTIRTRELESANRQLSEMAHLDGLTEIPNRRRLDEYLDEVWRQCRDNERHLSLLVIDVDHFKRFNDRFGHVQGDALLKRLARMLSQSLRRAEDLVARYGGEEFLVILPGAREDAAVQLAEAMREKVESTSLGATISVGVATTLPNGRLMPTDLVARADKALYQAKSDGRNCVRVSDGG
ncbi:MAG: diguanylate cyclase [Gammaproteobacteria bacterium]|nr:diguanylate cyclase [Gammaproteobacteria bacterium]